MRFVVYGAGAIGGVVGGRLFEHGHDVLLVARGAHYEAIRDHGLRVESPDGTVTLPIPVADHPREIAFTEGDVVLLGMKSQDTLVSLDVLTTVAADDTPVVCMQNGVANERIAIRRFSNVYGMCVLCPAEYLEPGVVYGYGTPIGGVLDVGRYPRGSDDTARSVASALDASTFSSLAQDDIMPWKYTKLLMNLGNAIEALCGRAARGGELFALAREEGMAVLRAAGIDFVSEEEDAARRADMRMRPIEGRRRGGGSTWQSFKRATGSIETDYLNGEIVLLGRLHGVPTPVNALLQRLATQAARDGSPPESMSPDDLLARLSMG